MTVQRAGMMEARVNGDPAGPPGFQAQLVGTNDVARVVEDVEELPGEDFPIAVEERAAEMFGQGFERAAVAGIVGENGIVAQARGDEVVLARVVRRGVFHSRGRDVVKPRGLDPGVAGVAGIGGAGHAGECSGNGTAVARSKELPLREREVRQLVEPDKQKFGALILVDVAVVAAEAKARGGAVVPGDQALRFIEAAVQTARNVAAKISEERGLQLGIGAAQQQRVAAGRFVGLKNRFPKQRLGLARASGPSEQTILRRRTMKILLAREGLIVVGETQQTVTGDS